MNKKLKLIIMAGISLASTLNIAFSSNIFKHDDPTTFVGPTLKSGFTKPFTDLTAFSVLGEAGKRNLRFSSTFGFNLSCNQRFKVSAEVLRQKIDYSFFTGDTERWVNQGATGIGYQYDLENFAYQPEFDINAYYSHANSESLSPRGASFTDNTGSLQTIVDNRRIAGSNASGVAPGLSVKPWLGSRIGADLNYDRVNYNTLYNSHNNDARGFGGTVHLEQEIIKNIGINVSASWRQPYNYYYASINWLDLPYFGKWLVGIDGMYTVGKNRLPDTYNIGVFANYYLDPAPSPIAISAVNLKDEVPVQRPQAANNKFIHWTGKPAVYQPQVLAIADEAISSITQPCACAVPTLSAALPGQINLQVTPLINPNVEINAAQYFTDTNLSYSIELNPPPINPGNFVTINQESGVVTGFLTDDVNDLTITATNACGSTSITTTLLSLSLNSLKK